MRQFVRRRLRVWHTAGIVATTGGRSGTMADQRQASQAATLAPTAGGSALLALSPRALRPEGRLQRLLPFAIPAVLGLALLVGPLTPPGPSDAARYTGAAVAAFAATSAAVLPWERWPRWLEQLPALGFVLGVLFVRFGVGQPAWNVSPLLLLSAFWLALYGTASGLVALLALIGGAGLLPGFFLPAHEAWSAPVMLGYLTISALLLTVQRLMREQHKRAQQLQQLLQMDPLTGAGNRRAWDEAMQRELGRARRRGNGLCVAVMDLDHFKRVNDQQGHAAGDALLRACVQAWQAILRPGDTLARIGGEEFALLLPECGRDEALGAVERIRLAVPAGATCSAGLAEWDRTETAAALLARADGALYAAKGAGRNQTCVA